MQEQRKRILQAKPIFSRSQMLPRRTEVDKRQIVDSSHGIQFCSVLYQPRDVRRFSHVHKSSAHR